MRRRPSLATGINGVSGDYNNTTTTMALINHHARSGDLQEARRIFSNTHPSHRTTSLWNSLITAHFNHNLPTDALNLFHQIPTRTSVTWNAMISGYARLSLLSEARHFFNWMPKSSRNVISYTALLRALLTSDINDHLAEAENLFHSMPDRNSISYTIMIGGLLRHPQRVEDARRLFDEMPHKDLVACTNMVSGLCSMGRVDEAREIFDDMQCKNVVSWTSMISGYATNGRIHVARKLFEIIPVERNEITWTAMVTGYLQAGHYQEAMELFMNMKEKSVCSCNALVLGLGQNGKVEEAREIFFNDTVKKDDTSWSVMMKVFMMNGYEMDVLNTFRKMQFSGVCCNNFQSIIGAIAVCANLTILDHGRQIHAEVLKTESFRSDVIIISALVTMYMKCGVVMKAKRVFNVFPNKDVAMWNSMITGYAQHGLFKEALGMFEGMLSMGMSPDNITFVGLLAVCSYTGSIDKGKEIFRSMRSVHMIDPKTEHYACMVDMLGRAGYIEEALELIVGEMHDAKVEADAVVWGSLLGACKTHMNSVVAEISAEKLVHLEPNNAGPYILLSNMYAKKGRWKDVEELRKTMKNRKLNKFPGYSWIEVEKKIHMFTGGDESTHPEHKSIFIMLDKLSRLLKEAGYCPDGSCTLHDIDEEQKVYNLRYHSERHAIAFGLLKVPEGMPIRVMKNLRVCGDCHAAIMLISKIMKREIILRDANRFHHFKEGFCSCKDYW